MKSYNEWVYSPISYIASIAICILMLSIFDIDTPEEEKVTRQIVIIDYPDTNFIDLSEIEAVIIDSVNADVLIDTVLIDPLVSTDVVIDSKLIDPIDAKEYLEELLASSPIYDRPSKKSIIRYYVKNLDGKKVRGLQKYGFYIHDRPSNLKTTHSSNALYLGDSIKDSDVLLVAYVLLTNGVELRHIAAAKAHDDWKANSIEVVTDTTVQNNEIITLSYLLDNWGDR
ncbi:MAG: hypothetical protein OCD76_02130 [Reichenbachiella sp.]